MSASIHIPSQRDPTDSASGDRIADTAGLFAADAHNRHGQLAVRSDAVPDCGLRRPLDEEA